MNAITCNTSRVLPNKLSNLYTPGLHGHPSTILISGRDPEPTVAARASMSELSFPISLSFINSVAGTCILLVLVGDCLLAFPPTYGLAPLLHLDGAGCRRRRP